MSTPNLTCRGNSLQDSMVEEKSKALTAVLQPLTVNTNIEYELDWSRFPGLAESQTEPTLTFHPDYSSWPGQHGTTLTHSGGNDDSILELLGKSIFLQFSNIR